MRFTTIHQFIVKTVVDKHKLAGYQALLTSFPGVVCQFVFINFAMLHHVF